MFRLTAQLAVILALLCLAVANIYVRATWSELEDGVLWNRTPEGVIVATEVAKGSPGARAGLREGDVLEAIDGRPIETVDDVTARLHAAPSGKALNYTVVRRTSLLSPDILQIELAPIPSGPRGLYFVLAAVGIFSLFVGAAVRLRRPDNQATLHFFWLTVAFFGDARVLVHRAARHARLGVLLGGRRRAAAPAAAVPALRAGVPGASRQPGCAATRAGRCRCSICRRCCSAARAWRRCCGRRDHRAVLSNLLTLVERGELLYLASASSPAWRS